jgi:hypothetical protein
VGAQVIRTKRRRAFAGGLALLSTAFGAVAATGWAQDYPAGRDAAALSAWLRGSGIEPEQVVAVTSLAVVAVVTPAGGKTGDVTLRAQALSQEARTRTGFASWEMPLSVDCVRGMVRLGQTTGYLERIPNSRGVSFGPAESSWRKPPQGTAVDNAWRAVCDPAFERPLASRGVQVTSSAPAVRPPPAARAAADIARPIPPPTRAPRPAPGSGVTVQVVSSPDADDSRLRLRQLRIHFGAAFEGRETRIETAQVRGRTVHRGVVAGFASRGEAASFCGDLQRGGQPCFVR